MRRKLKRSTGVISQMNVVPYIDVMLVLLVIFMITAPMFVPGVINLPSVSKAAKASMQIIEVNIAKNGDLSIVINGKTTNSSNINDLVSQLRPLATDEYSVVIAADKEVKYNDVINVVNSLYNAGIKKVALVVKANNS